jgi:hypothetical protein
MHRRVVALASRGGVARVAWGRWARAAAHAAALERLAAALFRAACASARRRLGARLLRWQRATAAAARAAAAAAHAAAAAAEAVGRAAAAARWQAQVCGVAQLLRHWGDGARRLAAQHGRWQRWRRATRAATAQAHAAAQAATADDRARLSGEYERKLLALDELCRRDTAALELRLSEKAAAAPVLEKRVAELEAQRAVRNIHM